MRAFRRKIDSTVSPTFVYLCTKKIDMYYILCIINYGISIFWTLVCYIFFENKLVLVLGFITPFILFCFFNIFIVYVKNGYFFIENITSLNYHISAHNKQVDLLMIKAKKLRTEILETDVESVYGEENGKLVQKVMEMEIARRQTFKLAKKMQ